MNNGFQISASGVLASVYKQNVHANNLANLATPGYKPDATVTQQRAPVRAEDSVWHLPSDDLIERLGSGVLMGPNRVSFKQGPLETTGNPLDLGIRGDGFFAVRDAMDASTDRIRLTRNGSLALDADNRLVTTGDGLPVLDIRNEEIRIPSGEPVQIASDGTIRQDGNAIAQIQLVDVPDRTQLEKQGEHLFKPSAGALARRTPATGRIVQGALEGSAVDEVRALMDVTSASRAVSANVGVVRYQDRLMELAINTFGRVA